MNEEASILLQYQWNAFGESEYVSENRTAYDPASNAGIFQMDSELHLVYPLELTAVKPGEKVKEITAKLEQGIKSLFESDRYKNYLKVMSKFHNYSLYNTILIAMQRPDATFVAGYNTWKNSFHRKVLKGERGIRILAPAPYKVRREMEKVDVLTRHPVIGKDGKVEMEEAEVTIPAFKVVSVFDVSQTEGQDLPTPGVDELKGNVEKYPLLFKAIEQASPVPVGFETIRNGAHGYYHQGEKRIALNEGMSELQNLKTLIHEIAHAKLHDVDITVPKDQQKGRVDRRTREVQAESIAYTVCQRYGIDTSDYSFAYVAGWSSGREMSELKVSLETIRDAASALIVEIDRNFALLVKCAEQEQTAAVKQCNDVRGNTYAIYQLSKQAPAELHFRNLAFLWEKGIPVDSGNYQNVYTADLGADTSLDDIFIKFNIDSPEDFKGHSLSVSDVVVLHKDGHDTAYYVDPIGFREIPEFLQPNNNRQTEKKTVQSKVIEMQKKESENYSQEAGLTPSICAQLSGKRDQTKTKTEHEKNTLSEMMGETGGIKRCETRRKKAQNSLLLR